jgi:hypothetical protein
LKRADLRRKWSTIPKAAPAPTKQAALHNQPSRFTVWRLFVWLEMPNIISWRRFKIARVLVRFNHVASMIVNVDHSVM